MKSIILIITLTFLCGCSLIRKDSSAEMEALSKDVLKSKEGIDIKITPVDKPQ